MKTTLSALVLAAAMTSVPLFVGCGGGNDDEKPDNAGGSGGSGGSGGGNGGDGGVGGSAGNAGGSGGVGGGAGMTVAIDPLMPAPTPEKVAGMEGIASEGPVWVAEPAGGYLLFSDLVLGMGDMPRIMRVDPAKPAGERLSVFNYKSAAKPATNGLAIGPDGDVYVCEASTGAIWKFKPPMGEPSLVADKFEGKTFGLGPNDIVVSNKGIVYFTTPVWAPVAAGQIKSTGAYMVGTDPARTVKRLFPEARFPQNPNGIALSPDESYLYIADDQLHEIYRYPLQADGTPGEGQSFIKKVQVADGIAIDDAGNIYVASNDGNAKAIRVFKPDGKPWGDIKFPTPPSNASFGGADRKTLYVTAGADIYKVQMTIPGRP